MSNRGGQRAGSGRKAIDPAEKRVQTTISVSPETKAGLATLRRQGVKIGAEVDNLVAGLLRNEKK